MFKKPGVHIGCLRDMGNASNWMDEIEGYDDGGDPEGALGMRWRGLNKLFTGWVRRGRSQRKAMARRDGQTEIAPARTLAGPGSEMGRIVPGQAPAMRGRRRRAARIRDPQARR